METRQVVVVQHEEKSDHLSQAVTMLANDRNVSAAEIGRRLKIPYAKALPLSKQARQLLARPGPA